ncbi:MAG: hypothetical protein EBU90_10645 [Proteobacteria bacterium]|nr:hypothetical protein [Pseudomonadota bacterium]NBP14577.1 hypothetical protein [bacterium]
MRNFKVYLDLTDIYPQIKKFFLREYVVQYPLIFIEADDPDDACYMVIYRLIKLIMDQDPSIETRILCKQIKRLVRIDKVISL